MKNFNCILTSLILFGTGLSLVSPAMADPLPGQHLKFYQMPLNNGATPYLPVPSFPATPTPLPPYGTVASSAIYPGHDELSTATRTSEFAPWQGTYMADDFADYAGTPVSHVRWWGSYMNGTQPTGLGGGVKRFLISFEHNVPASINPTNGEVIPSHPDFFHPGNLHQIVEFTPPVAGGLTPGKFTEKFVPTPGGPVAPLEGLFEYNAELHIDKWFPEAAAKAGENNVYWLKIVALVDAQLDGPLQWGWHNRDWSIPNALAAMPGDTPDGAERVIGGVPGPGGTQPVWHFEDDAVTGGIFVNPQPNMPYMPIVDQNSFAPQSYLPPWDGPSVIGQYSKDLAFELYTPVPEPSTMVLIGLGAIVLTVNCYRRSRC